MSTKRLDREGLVEELSRASFLAGHTFAEWMNIRESDEYLGEELSRAYLLRADYMKGLSKIIIENDPEIASIDQSLIEEANEIMLEAGASGRMNFGDKKETR